MKIALTITINSVAFCAASFAKGNALAMLVISAMASQVFVLHQKKTKPTDAAGSNTYSDIFSSVLGLGVLCTSYVNDKLILGVVFCLLAWLATLLVQPPKTKL